MNDEGVRRFLQLNRLIDDFVVLLVASFLSLLRLLVLHFGIFDEKLPLDTIQTDLTSRYSL
jgi:hypothetical protein